jgi:putative ABC transport system substrate-binding protein
MKRREFLVLLAGAVACSANAWAQKAAQPVVGVLNSGSADAYAPMMAVFREALAEAGYIEHKNVAIEYRWADGQFDRLPTLAADLVRRQVTLIAAIGSAVGVRAAMAETTTIPIVFSTSVDPIEAGFVTRLNRPGGNITGFTSLSAEIRPKWLELVRELVPGTTSIGLLVNPANRSTAETATRDLMDAAGKLGAVMHVVQASSEQDFDRAFATLLEERARALIIANDALFTGRIKLLAELTLRHRVPAIFQYRDFAVAGGLITYGGSRAESYRHLGLYAARILKGEKPADLPVLQATKVELVINLKTAKALGLTVPSSLLARADELIE